MILTLNIIINKREGGREGVEDDANGLAELLEEWKCHGLQWRKLRWGWWGGREVTVRRAKFESQVQMPGGGWIPEPGVEGPNLC